MNNWVSNQVITFLTEYLVDQLSNWSNKSLIGAVTNTLFNLLSNQ